MAWLVVNIGPLLSMVGILLDMIGAVLVAYEVVKRFRGKQFIGSFTFDNSMQLPPVESPEYKKWSHDRSRNMTLGVVLLTLGFLLQLIANGLQLKF